ncbi:hypothetical protein EIP91_011439 [Steccherinum ochraceum]|uniref:Uncharacterized protein n=1 Tax=Steccherinum ochraceum TaxID=92696 RepID=A0A4R0RIF5_9APHY|nr:hypothetical protein EIP91_011439 [Steccherinum ochraceum]
MGWLNCVNFPCAMRLSAEHPARYGDDVAAWRTAKVWPPLGTPAQTIRVAEEGMCRLCQDWEDLHVAMGVNAPPMPMWKITGMAYPVDLEYAGPGNGRPWTYERLVEGYWVWVLDGWLGGAKVVDEDGYPMVHFPPVRGVTWPLDSPAAAYKKVEPVGKMRTGWRPTKRRDIGELDLAQVNTKLTQWPKYGRTKSESSETDSDVSVRRWVSGKKTYARAVTVGV